jgi:hypothetical protein
VSWSAPFGRFVLIANRSLLDLPVGSQQVRLVTPGSSPALPKDLKHYCLQSRSRKCLIEVGNLLRLDHSPL